MSGVITTVIVLVIFGGILYLVLRPKDKGEGQGWDAYFYIVSFIALALLYWAVADLVRVWLQQAWGVGSTYVGYSYYSGTPSNQDLLRSISLRLSAIIVCLPIWAFHWYKAIVKPDGEVDTSTKKSYAMAVLVLTSVTVLGGGTGLVYQLVNSVLGVGESQIDALSWLIPYTLAAAGLWVVHFKLWLSVKRKVKEGV